MSASTTNQRGAALLLVMWLIALLASLIGAFALSARIERLQERVLTRGAVAGEAARAGLEMALVRVDDPDPRRRWVPDGRTYRWQYAGVPSAFWPEDLAFFSSSSDAITRRVPTTSGCSSV